MTAIYRDAIHTSHAGALDYRAACPTCRQDVLWHASPAEPFPTPDCATCEER